MLDLNEIAQEFDLLCQERHNTGREQYGEYKFLHNNMFQMMAEELADLANYARYQYIKLRLMEVLSASGPDQSSAGDEESSDARNELQDALAEFGRTYGVHSYYPASSGVEDPRQRSGGEGPEDGFRAAADGGGV